MRKENQNRPLDKDLEIIIQKIHNERYLWLKRLDSMDNRGMDHRRMTQARRKEEEIR